MNTTIIPVRDQARFIPLMCSACLRNYRGNHVLPRTMHTMHRYRVSPLVNVLDLPALKADESDMLLTDRCLEATVCL